MGSLSNFFASLFRHRKGNLHKYEIGGQATVALGILLVLMDTCLSGSNRIGESELGNKIKYDVSSSRGQQFLADIVQIPINRKDCIADIINDRQNYFSHRGDSKYFPPVSFYDDLEWHERHKYVRNGIFFQRGYI